MARLCVVIFDFFHIFAWIYACWRFCDLILKFMDIDLLSKMVKELILDSDKVVLPGLGCFVAEIVPSTFSDKGYTINPPYRRLHFRSKPDSGDELVKFYARSNNIPMEMADRIVMDFVTELKSVLHLKKTVVFPGLGRLRATKENNVFFVADEDLDIYPDGFALEPISLKTNQETPEEVSAAVEGLKSLLEEPSSPGEINVEPQSDPQPELQPEAPAEPDTKSEEQSDPSEVQPEPELESAPEPQSQPEHESQPLSQPHVSSPHSGRSVWKKLVWTIAILVIVAAVLFGVFFAISRICPELLDSILYTKEELEVINWTI